MEGREVKSLILGKLGSYRNLAESPSVGSSSVMGCFRKR